MTQDEIISLAREAGSIDSEDVILTIYAAFAAHEREACAKVCEDKHDYMCSRAAAAIRARSK